MHTKHIPHTQIHRYIHKSVHSYILTKKYKHTQINIYTYTDIYTNTHTLTYAYLHTHNHSYIHNDIKSTHTLIIHTKPIVPIKTHKHIHKIAFIHSYMNTQTNAHTLIQTHIS
jgi:hypothetical protein